jgi:hypothetical protein
VINNREDIIEDVEALPFERKLLSSIFRYLLRYDISSHEDGRVRRNIGLARIPTGTRKDPKFSNPFMRNSRALLIPVFFLAGACATFLPHHRGRELLHIVRDGHLPIPAGKPLIGTIETAGYKNDELTAKRESKLSLAGWAAFTSPNNPIQQLDVLLDGRKIAEVRSFSSRPDVVSAYDRPDFEASGWQSAPSIAGIAPGNHVLVVRATSQNGSTADLPSLVLNIQ